MAGDSKMVIALGAIGIGAFLWWRKKSIPDQSDNPDASSSDDSAEAVDNSDLGDDPAVPLGGSAQPGAFGAYTALVYPPWDQSTYDLFTSAAKYAGLPVEWATMDGLHQILAKESQGYVGRPNYQFAALAATDQQSQWPKVWAAIRNGTWKDLIDFSTVKNPEGLPSSATGLGQLTVTNIKGSNLYPSGVNGIGNALEEAVGMLRYIATKKGPLGPYVDPDGAWAQYGSKGGPHHEGY